MISLVLAFVLVGCAAQPRLPTLPGDVQRGKATWYGGRLHGGPTASGERFDENAMTCAHRTLPMNTIVEVENLDNGRRVTLRVNDRGPYGPGRIIDVSHEAARRLDMVEAGVVPVTVRVVSTPPPKAKKKKRS
jgi:rare lipoprotein A